MYSHLRPQFQLTPLPAMMAGMMVLFLLAISPTLAYGEAEVEEEDVSVEEDVSAEEDISTEENVSAQEDPQEAETPECATYVSESARQEFRELVFLGLACFEAQRYDWALSHYLAAYSMNPAPHLHAVIGRTLHELGFYDPALAHYRSYLENEGDTSGAERIRARIEQLREQMDEDGATVSLRSSPPHARTYLVLENGEWYLLDTTPSDIALRQGRYDFVFEDDDHRPRHITQRLRTGRERQVLAELVSHDDVFDVSARQWRRAGAWTMGLSAPVAVTGIVLLTLSVQRTSEARELENNFTDIAEYDRRRLDLLDDASAFRTWGTVTTAVGATGLLVGAIFYSTPGSRDSSTEPANDEIGDGQEVSRLHHSRWEPVVGLNQLGLRLRF